MATLIPLLILSLAASTTSLTAQSRVSNNITVGSSLSTKTNNSFWPSPSGRFAFGFYPEQNGFKVGIWITGIQNITIVWTAKRDDPPVFDVATLFLTDKGLILGTQNQNTTISDGFSGLVYLASMLDSGNFVLYNSDSQIIWQSFDSPTDTILSGQRLLAGTQLFSGVNETGHSTGRYRLKMQTDGNLVLYPVNTEDTAPYAYWATNKYGLGNDGSLKLDSNGLLYLLSGTGFNFETLYQASSSFKTEIIYRATLDVDGIFRLYSHSFGRRTGSSNTSVIWVSNKDRCEVKGCCGFYSFCSLTDTKPTCLCPPGFDYVNPSDEHEGCERISTVSDCSKINTENVTFSISTLANTSWGDAPYDILLTVTREECSKACLEDCKCQVALYKDGRCSKQLLPLIYGRRNFLDSVTTYVKVSSIPMQPPTIPTQRLVRVLFHVFTVVASCLFVLVAFSGLGIIVNRSQIRRYHDFMGYKVMNSGINLRSFTYRDLHEATNGFQEVLGRGAFGSVFRGTLFGNVKIAVKKLEKVMAEGERQFQTEMNVIAKTHHRNLIRLLGYCDEGSYRLLVYEFMCNGTLADLLFQGQRWLNWEERVRISSEIALGLLYLHEECDTQIIHCDIKPQNILLDDSWTAKISDFGLAKLLDIDQTRTLTDARGTRGYVAPEWNRRIPINAKVDVYSFGVMLLEIICCRKSLRADVPDNEIILSDWVYECFSKGKLQKLIAPEELESSVEIRRLERMVMVALWCIQEVPFLRPSMKSVFLMLEGMVDIQAPPSPIAPILAGTLTYSKESYMVI